MKDPFCRVELILGGCLCFSITMEDSSWPWMARGTSLFPLQGAKR